MIVRRASFPLSLALLALAAPVSASKRPDLQGEKIMMDFARCAVRGAPDDARALLQTSPGTAAEAQMLVSFTRKRLGCMNFGPTMGPMQLKLNARVIRGAVAKRLYLDFERRAPAPLAFAATADDGAATASPEYSVVRCAVSRSPQAADRLVRASRGSAEEAAAAQALSPALNECARGRGRMDISGTAIHGWAAEALYKLHRSNSAGMR